MRFKQLFQNLFRRSSASAATTQKVSIEELIKLLWENRENVVAIEITKWLQNANERYYILGIKPENSTAVYDSQLVQKAFINILKGNSDIEYSELKCDDHLLYTTTTDCNTLRELKTNEVYLEALNIPKFDQTDTVLDIDIWLPYYSHSYAQPIKERNIKAYRNAFFNLIPKLKSSIFYAGYLNFKPIGKNGLIEFNSFNHKLYIKLFGKTFQAVTHNYYLPFNPGEQYKQFKARYEEFKQEKPYVSARLVWYLKNIDFDKGYVILKPKKLLVQYGLLKKRIKLPNNKLSARELMNLINTQIKFIENHLKPRKLDNLKNSIVNTFRQILFICNLYSANKLDREGLLITRQHISHFRSKIDNHLKIYDLDVRTIEVLNLARDRLSKLEGICQRGEIDAIYTATKNILNELTDILF